MPKIYNEPNIKIKTELVTICEPYCRLRQKEKSVVLILSLFKHFLALTSIFKNIVLFYLSWLLSFKFCS